MFVELAKSLMKEDKCLDKAKIYSSMFLSAKHSGKIYPHVKKKFFFVVPASIVNIIFVLFYDVIKF